MKIDSILIDWQLNDGEAESLIKEAIKPLHFNLPDDYVQFLGRHNGGEGFVGDYYLILWRAEELVPFNRDYETMKYAPGIILFGSNGGGEGYGFDTRYPSMPVVKIPFIGMELRYAKEVATSLTDLIDRLSR